MNIKKMNYVEFENAMYKFNSEHKITSQSGNKRLYGIIVFTEDSFNKKFTKSQRSYFTDNLQKAFLPNMIGSSLSASCLDGTDVDVRLDWYMKGEKPWHVEYCYIIEDMNVVRVSKETGEEKPVDLYTVLCLTGGKERWKARAVAQMLADGLEVQTSFDTYRKN